MFDNMQELEELEAAVKAASTPEEIEAVSERVNALIEELNVVGERAESMARDIETRTGYKRPESPLPQVMTAAELERIGR